MILRKTEKAEVPIIWRILQQAIEQRRLDGSKQWQDGYPNEATIFNDIKNGYGFVLTDNQQIVAYAAVIFDVEPAYEAIEGNWLTNGKYVVVHRVAVEDDLKRKGIATTLFQFIENFAVENNVFSIKVDTNFDNFPMLKIMQKLNYTYCGEVYFRGSARKAFEKVLND